MFSLRDLCFMLCSLDLDVLRAQRIIGFLFWITHKSKVRKSNHKVQQLLTELFIWSQENIIQ